MPGQDEALADWPAGCELSCCSLYGSIASHFSHDGGVHVKGDGVVLLV